MAAGPIVPILEARATQGLTIINDGLAILVADATVQEKHSTQVNITDFPREDLSPASDHIQPLPAVVSTEIIVSKTSLVAQGGINRDRDAYEVLRRIQTARLTVTLNSSLRVWENMGLQTLDVVRDSQTGQKLLASCTWKQVTPVSTVQTDIPANIIRSSARASGKTEDPTADQVKDDNGSPARKRTLAKRLKVLAVGE